MLFAALTVSHSSNLSDYARPQMTCFFSQPKAKIECRHSWRRAQSGPPPVANPQFQRQQTNRREVAYRESPLRTEAVSKLLHPPRYSSAVRRAFPPFDLLIGTDPTAVIGQLVVTRGFIWCKCCNSWRLVKTPLTTYWLRGDTGIRLLDIIG